MPAIPRSPSSHAERWATLRRVDSLDCARPVRLAALIGCGFILLGCSEPSNPASAQDCIADNPATLPFDVGADQSLAPTPASGAGVPTPLTAESISQDCVTDGGTGCDSAEFISKDAAKCIAVLNEFKDGLGPWEAAMTYHYMHRRVVWNVSNRLQGEEGGEHSGEMLTIDATSGEVLQISGYDVQF